MHLSWNVSCFSVLSVECCFTNVRLAKFSTEFLEIKFVTQSNLHPWNDFCGCPSVTHHDVTWWAWDNVICDELGDLLGASRFPIESFSFAPDDPENTPLVVTFSINFHSTPEVASSCCPAIPGARLVHTTVARKIHQWQSS